MFATKGSARTIRECLEDIVMAAKPRVAVDTLYSIDVDIGVGIDGIPQQKLKGTDQEALHATRKLCISAFIGYV